VISCPCALVVSIPLSYFGGIGAAAAGGILIKGSNYLEALANAGIVVFDKTGTLTTGSLQLTKINPSSFMIDQYGEDQAREMLLAYCAAAEQYSSHPIAKALLKACGERYKDLQVDEVKEHRGHGVSATVEGHRILTGNRKLLENNLILIEAEALLHETAVYVAVDGYFAGSIALSDTIKEESKRSIERLSDHGIRNIVMLTGDTKVVAESVATSLGIREVHSDLLPADKVIQVEAYMKSKDYPKQTLIFVGDGINDAPVLMRADVGLAMGAMGSDAAIKAADVVLMDDNPVKVVSAIAIARKCRRIVMQNIVFALGVKAICLLLGVFGIATMWIAVMADVGVMVLAVLNALRCLRTHPKYLA
jgi:Cd2+/Zn2+-exporting ATPase